MVSVEKPAPMRRLGNVLVSIAILALTLTGCVPQAATPSKLVIAVQPTATPAELSASGGELRTFLSQRLGREVEIVFPTTYAGVVEALRFGNAQAAFMSAWPARLAWKLADADIGLAEVREVVIGQDKKEEPFYFSYWVVSKTSAVT